jgi:hypothetical protein
VGRSLDQDSRSGIIGRLVGSLRFETEEEATGDLKAFACFDGDPGPACQITKL